ncbi:MAG: WG repeat-containing protein, partial [Alistipes onderdonkii]
AIPCRFTKAYPFNDGIAMVRQGYEVFTIDTLKKSPRWTPGTANGLPVDVRYETSFKFQYR